MSKTISPLSAEESVVSASKPRRGRPKGSRNKDYAVIKVIPAACPSCGSHDLKVHKGAPRPDLVGRFSNTEGLVYRRVRWKDTTCQSCGQAVRQHLQMDPE